METVQVYGETGFGWCRDCSGLERGGYGGCGKKDHNNVDGGKLLGPFYCGMSSMMNMPQFAMLLLSPTSTTLHVEVALKFSGEDGIVIEFRNDTGITMLTNGFDVSFISRYKEEDERYIYILL